jgi:erythronate-4-phosphate dehydrogenase
MKIVADENIIYVKEAFSSLGDIFLYAGRDITHSILVDADVLLVRSVTIVNSNLLKGTNVKFVGTATIGTDHIDMDYLDKNGIYFADAKGCNSDAVAEYVFTALVNIARQQEISLKDKTIGVVGVGNIGSRIVRLADAIGMQVLQNDPPLKRETGNDWFRNLDELMNADIITIHVPLNMSGEDKTYHLFDFDRINSLKNQSVLINASRGPVVHNQALNELIIKKQLTVVLDVWENEPVLNMELLDKVQYATPHIAGYSYEGKINGTVILYHAVCGYLGKEPAWSPSYSPPENSLIKIAGTSSLEQELFTIVKYVYDITRDDNTLRGIQKAGDPGKYFDLLRKNYDLRREFLNYFIKIEPCNNNLAKILKSFRFQIIPDA